MKQHITPEQLEELSEEGRKKLRDWWKRERGDKFTIYGKEFFVGEGIGYGDEADPDYRTPTTLPLLSIGQMIEFLDEHTDKAHLERWWYKVFEVNDGFIDLKYKRELADALWEAVKEVLEDED